MANALVSRLFERKFQRPPVYLRRIARKVPLEEMFGVTIRYGYIWSGADRKRHRVAVDQAARDTVIGIAGQVRSLIANGRLPGPAPASRCRRCSMSVGCMPRLLDKPRRHARAAAALYTIGDDADDH